MPTYRNDPRIIKAKFNSTCAESGKAIKKGEDCVYYPSSRQVFHMESEQARRFQSDQHDMRMEDLACERMNY